MVIKSLIPRTATLLIGLALFALCAAQDLSPLLPWLGFSSLGLVLGAIELFIAVGNHHAALTVHNGRSIITSNHLADEITRTAKQVVVFAIGIGVLNQSGWVHGGNSWNMIAIGLSLFPLLVLSNQVGGVVYRIQIKQHVEGKYVP